MQVNLYKDPHPQAEWSQDSCNHSIFRLLAAAGYRNEALARDYEVFRP